MVTSDPWVLTLKGGAQEREGFGCRCKRAEPAIQEGWVGLGEMGAATLPCDHGLLTTCPLQHQSLHRGPELLIFEWANMLRRVTGGHVI